MPLFPSICSRNFLCPCLSVPALAYKVAVYNQRCQDLAPSWPIKGSPYSLHSDHDTPPMLPLLNTSSTTRRLQLYFTLNLLHFRLTATLLIHLQTIPGRQRIDQEHLRASSSAVKVHGIATTNSKRAVNTQQVLNYFPLKSFHKQYERY